MKLFSELTYVHPDAAKLVESIKAAAGQMKDCRSYEEFKGLFLKLKEEQAHYDTMENVAYIRNSIDTTDEFYRKEMEYFHASTPVVNMEMGKVSEILLKSDFTEDFSDDFGELYLEKLRVKNRLLSESNIEKQVAESGLVQEYFKVSASPVTEFQGGQVNFYGLLKAMQSTDRRVRKEAFLAWAKLYESISEKLDDIYGRLMKLRMEMAKNLGLSDYTEMAYLGLERFSYGPDEIARFRKQVEQAVVPLCRELFEKQRERLGVDKLCYYDEALIYPEGNAVPKGDTKELLEKAGEMYRELSAETGEFFDFMLEHDLFDLETRMGKQQGGYCTILADYKAPFIFSNFNGTSADAFVLTHEAGHAFEAYTASRQGILPDQVFASAAIDEIHSMSMEFFTYPYMELLFGEEADRYREEHLLSVLQVIPYMTCVDEFQHRVYAEELFDAKDRRRAWKELEKKYLPWRDYDGNAFLGEGGFWMQKQHIFMSPFYYIDYAMAQFGALEYFARMKEEPEAAWEDYVRLCKAGGTKGYFELLKEGNLSNPFEEGTLKKIIEKLR